MLQTIDENEERRAASIREFRCGYSTKKPGPDNQNRKGDDAHKYVIGKTPQGFTDYIDRSNQGEIYLDYGTVMIGLSLFTIDPNGKRIGFDWSSQDIQFQGPRFIPQGKLKVGLGVAQK